MARKKTARHAAKRQSTSGSATAILRMEKDFHDAPAKLIAQLTKEINLLKQKESKFKKALHKSKTQLKTHATRLKVSAKVKTATGKKQYTAAKTAHNKLMQNQNVLNKQLADVSKSLDMATSKQAKLQALRKQLSQFDKTWKSSAKKKATKAKTAGSKSKKKATFSKSTSTFPFSEQNQQPKPKETYQTSLDDLRVDETTEVTS